jgi:hypothetical protein
MYFVKINSFLKRKHRVCRTFEMTHVYFYSKTNQMHNISNLFYFGTTIYMFWMVSPSIIRSLRLYTQAATEPVWHIPVAVCTVLESWWWAERPSKTCRVLFQNKINLRYCASGWFYSRNIFRCTVLQKSNQLNPVWITSSPAFNSLFWWTSQSWEKGLCVCFRDSHCTEIQFGVKWTLDAPQIPRRFNCTIKLG